MRTVKKWIIAGLALLAAAVVCVVGYFELRYPCTELVMVSSNAERILREEPEAAVSEKDRALLEALRVCPMVRDAKESFDENAAEQPELLEAVRSFLGEEKADSARLSVLIQEDWDTIFFSWTPENLKTVNLQAQRLGTESCLKVLAVYQENGRDLKCSYQDLGGGELSKWKTRRRWFSYFRDRLWGDNYVSSPGTE